MNASAPGPQDTVFTSCLLTLEMAFRQLESRVPQPIRKPWSTSFVFRFAEQTIHEAIVQKLARTISGLHGLHALLERGLFQELGVLQRAVDEIDEDVWFLSLAVIDNDITARHQEFLRYFYAEEFTDPLDPMGSHSSRGMVKRDKILRVRAQPAERHRCCSRQSSWEGAYESVLWVRPRGISAHNGHVWRHSAAL